ncbi:hypothetical protein STEG23_003522, partial [Scotinomys teguina]
MLDVRLIFVAPEGLKNASCEEKPAVGSSSLTSFMLYKQMRKPSLAETHGVANVVTGKCKIKHQVCPATKPILLTTVLSYNAIDEDRKLQLTASFTRYSLLRVFHKKSLL